jgi:hypothetical protein
VGGGRGQEACKNAAKPGVGGVGGGAVLMDEAEGQREKKKTTRGGLVYLKIALRVTVQNCQ